MEVEYFIPDSKGNIEWFGTFNENQLPNHPSAVVGYARPDTHYVNSEGVLCLYTIEEQQAKTNRPTIAHVWDNSSMSWICVLSIEEQRAVAWTRIKAAREQASNAAFITTSVGMFDGDKTAVENVMKTLSGWRESQALGVAPETITWTLADNTSVEITLPQLSELAVAMLQRGQAAYAIARNLRQAIEAAPDQATLDAIQWPTE